MLTILIVEDEKDTLEGLKSLIPWEELGISKVYGASDGLAAIDLCESLYPDILITDIRMPKMDGIQLAFYIRERFPECGIIFLSGYADKDYLKSAVRLGALNYIEKPVNLEEVKSAVSSAAALCLTYTKQREKESYMQDIVRKSLPLITQKLAIDLAMNIVDSNTIKNLEAYWPHVNCPGYFYTSVLIKIKSQMLLPEEEAERLKLLVSDKTLQNLEFQKHNTNAVAGLLNNDKIVLHFNKAILPSDNSTSRIIHVLEENVAHALNHDIQMTVAVGKPVSQPADLHQSFKTSAEGLKKQFFREHGSVIFFGESEKKSFSFNDSCIEEFNESLNSGKKEEALVFLDHLAADISNYQDTDIGYIKNIFFKIFQTLFDFSKNRNMILDDLEREGYYWWQEISSMETVFDIAAYMKTLVVMLFLKMEESENSNKFMHEIVRYIEKNFADHTLSVKHLAEHFHYNHYYLCTLFKRYTEKTINSYITEVRIKKAEALLKQMDIRLKDIGRMLGYNDPAYFRKIFKKHTRYTPSEFREMHRK